MCCCCCGKGVGIMMVTGVVDDAGLLLSTLLLAFLVAHAVASWCCQWCSGPLSMILSSQVNSHIRCSRHEVIDAAGPSMMLHHHLQVHSCMHHCCDHQP